ncbi:MAG TPA: ABC transporter ATP-binding protein [Bacillota bacterium]|jgi:putative ABC transport system ATP-binding protein|nr:ABC transporter ATP-binding protein [Peptococcaceae bacterium MAG4]NLW37167.1 ABC transporter ATP-binding protein [Peptococcaceae bacterium]HPZ44234.1 ABC transporter ATP-binding protein [Bacillota bacterium]HQD76853.1 ABC transporter ATP-binding protein [Bacillota bacterium]HUM59244.1 ABC transporter ATP-binding protein [Bacillota bacterium]
MADVLISVQNLVRVYGRRSREVKALDIQRLDLARGDFVAVTGPSGCGKTTFLNLLGALDRPSRGSIFFEGRDLAGLGEAGLCRYRREKAGFIFQAYCLIPSLTALQNVLAPVYPRGNGRRMRERARELLRRLGLAGVEKRRPGELSGGEQQRVAIARALLLDPELILADEPTGNLDSATGAGIISLLKDLNDAGKTVLVASHDQRVADACGRVLRLEDGRLV